MKSVIKAVIAVVVLAGVAGAAGTEFSTEISGLKEAAAVNVPPAVKAAPASLTWKVKGDKYMAVGKGEGLPEIVVKVKGIRADITLGGEKVTCSVTDNRIVYKHGGDTLASKGEGKTLAFNGKPFTFTSVETKTAIIIKFRGMTVKYMHESGDVVLSGDITPENIKIAAFFEIGNLMAGMVMAQA